MIIFYLPPLIKFEQNHKRQRFSVFDYISGAALV